MRARFDSQIWHRSLFDEAIQTFQEETKKVLQLTVSLTAHAGTSPKLLNDNLGTYTKGTAMTSSMLRH